MIQSPFTVAVLSCRAPASFKVKEIQRNLPHLLRDSVIQRLGAHHAAIQLLGVRMCPHPLLCLAVCAALAVEAGRRVTWDRQGGVKGVGRQRAGEEVLV